MACLHSCIVLLFASCTISNGEVLGSGNLNDINYMVKKRGSNNGASMYPQATETRDLKDLNGIWYFRKSSIDPEQGFREKWYLDDLEKTGPVMHMPVPSSYNDLSTDAELRDHVGLVWYDRRFYVPSWWGQTKQKIWLRFSSVHYAAQVWVNGKYVGFHEIGHLPFAIDITDAVYFNQSNLVSVAVDNTLLSDTVPQGSVSEIHYNNEAHLQQHYTFDFFNYAGIHRTVFLYSTPQLFIDDIHVTTDVQGLTGIIIYNVSMSGASVADDVTCCTQLFDKNGTLLLSANDCSGVLDVPNANLWWPYLTHDTPGYLYTMKVSLTNSQGNIIDAYYQKVGIRKVSWSNTTIYLNNKPIYLRGFGMHEDSDLRGKGWDPVLWVKNFDLIKWLGANAFRTSHYPYAEEIYQLADENGIMIIDECPSGDTTLFTPPLMVKHKQSLTELINRDKNHPSVIMWSISNEPRSDNNLADNYFREIVSHVKSMDTSRPVTMAIAQGVNVDKGGKHLDVISFNRYNAWYANPAALYYVTNNVVAEATSWFNKHNKPILMSEYGADALAGLHRLPETMWSEEFQIGLMSEHFKAFDNLRKKSFFNGEFIWNFADFMTQQGLTRVGGNKKGMFTRQRQPKEAAHNLRLRYQSLAAADAGLEPPPLRHYISDDTPIYRDEL